MATYYEILQVKQTASDGEIKKAYRRLVLIHHPDRGGDATVFNSIQIAYETLSNEKKRVAYDLNLLVAKYQQQKSYAPKRQVTFRAQFITRGGQKYFEKRQMINSLLDVRDFYRGENVRVEDVLDQIVDMLESF